METYNDEEEFGENETSSLLSAFNNDPHILDNIHVRVMLIFLYTVIFIFCVFGNLAVILVVTLHWKMRSMTKFCVGNMAVANLSVGIFCVYQNLSTYLFDSWFFGEFMCKMYHFVTSLCHTASVLILVVLSIERYLVLLHSFKSIQMLTKRNLVLTVVGVWTLAAIISLPRLFYFGLLHVSLSDTHSGEICVPRKSKYNSATADTVYFVLLYVIPLGIITVLYARIAWYLRQSGEWMPHANEASTSWRGGNNSFQVSGNNQFVEQTASYNPRPSSLRNSQVNSESERFNRNGTEDDNEAEDTTSTSGFEYAVRGEWIKVRTNKKRQARRAHTSHPTSRRSSRKGQRRRRHDSFSSPHLSNILRRERHSGVVRMLIVIVMTFALLNLPFHVRKLCLHYLSSFDMSSDLNNVIAPLTFLLTYANCAINPILYAFLSKHFRKSFVDLLHCRRNRSQVPANFV